MARYAVRRTGCGTTQSCRHNVLGEFADLDDALDFAESRGGEVVRISDGYHWAVDGWVPPAPSAGEAGESA